MYWIHIIQGRDRLRAVVITVMNRLHKIWRFFDQVSSVGYVRAPSESMNMGTRWLWKQN